MNGRAEAEPERHDQRDNRGELQTEPAQSQQRAAGDDRKDRRHDRRDPYDARAEGEADEQRDEGEFDRQPAR